MPKQSFKIYNNNGNIDCFFQIIEKIINNNREIYKNTEIFNSYNVRKQLSDNVFLVNNIKNLSDLHNNILKYNHACTHIDLELASYTFNMVFIGIKQKKNINNRENMKIIKNIFFILCFFFFTNSVLASHFRYGDI